MISLKGENFISLKDFSREELQYILDLSFDIKKKQKAGEKTPVLKNKVLAMIFKKASTRTRIAFEVGMYQLGGSSVFLSPQESQIGRGEPIEDTARVLSGFVDGILIRTFDQKEVDDLAKYASVPVINGLTDLFHPTQVMADMMTIIEEKGKLEGINLTYIGDGNNMAHSLLIGGAIMGMNVTIATPECYQVNTEIKELAESLKKDQNTTLKYVNCPLEGAKGADVLYTDVWASMGQEEEAAARKEVFKGFQINEKVLELAKKDAIVMHCLPAYKGQEITAEIFEKYSQVIFNESENRLHAHKGILAAIM
ncbi:MAG: ornithine carbamoyltransferase [Eubacteriales bacterium]|nr:ornithine carbamoyltransferase [Eubacteriales bacterium]